MSNNGDGTKEILKITIKDGKIDVIFGGANIALVSHAVRLASLQLDNMIIAGQQPKSNLEIPGAVLDKVNRGMRL